MLSVIKSMALNGLDGYLVNVETDVSGGLPSFDIVGLPDVSVKEAQKRISAAIKNSKIEFPSRKILINLAPASTRKEGTGLDLPMAVGVLMAIGKINKKKDLSKTAFIGELSLDGKINRINGILPMCIEAMRLGLKKVFIPDANKKEAAVVKGIDVIPVSNLNNVIKILTNKNFPEGYKVNVSKLLKESDNYDVDFAEVKGQENIKRALEVSAAGRSQLSYAADRLVHGKTMLAKRLPTILPGLTFEEALEITKIQSIAGILPDGSSIINTRPFRAPHHTASSSAMVGGGKNPKPGEISLAHFGVLFLDELPEFNKNALEVLRGPLEDKKVTISRVNGTVSYPADFMFIASMNPCPCGYYGSGEKECVCTPQAINRYMGKISGPLLDRIDIHIEVKPVKYKKLSSDEKIENSETIKKRVNKAREIQINRYKNLNIFSNSALTPKLIERYCKIDEKGKKILDTAFKKLGLSARAYTRILKVARTIADLDNQETINYKHLAEAIQYRSLDRKYGEI